MDSKAPQDNLGGGTADKDKDMDLVESPLKFRMNQRGAWTCTGPD